MRSLLVGGAPSKGSESLVKSLASSVGHVLAVDGGGALCLAAGIRPDVVIGDLDSLEPASAQELASLDVPFIRFSADKDATDLDLALEHARSVGVDRIVLTGVATGRLDHTLGVLGSLARNADLRPAVEELTVSISILSADDRERLRVTPFGATVSAIALLEPAVLSATGVRWPLDRAALAPLETLGVSNVVLGDEAVFTAHMGRLAIVAPTLGGLKADLWDET